MVGDHESWCSNGTWATAVVVTYTQSSFTGTDLVITYGKPPGAQFPQTTITPRRRASALSDDPEIVNRLLETVPDFSEVFAESRRTPDEVQKTLDEFLLDEEDAEETSAETSKYGSTTSGDSSSSVEEAFSDLLS